MAKKKPEVTSNNQKKRQQKQLVSNVFQVPEDVVIPEPDEEELELMKLVFGDQAGFEDNLKALENFQNESSEEEDEDELETVEEDEEDEENLENVQDDLLFFMDDNNNNDTIGKVDADGDEEMISETNSELEEEEPVWIDSDDEELHINLLESSKLKKLRTDYDEETINSKRFIGRLRNQFEKVYPRPRWVDEAKEEQEEQEQEVNEEGVSEEEENEGEFDDIYNPKALLSLVESKISYKQPKPARLISPKTLNIARLKDANIKRLSESAIQTIQFHPDLPILLTGGYDRTLRLYHIDGKNNNLVNSIHFRNSPIQNAYFANPNGTNKVFLAGRRKFMYKLDLISGEVEKISTLYGIKNLQKSFENFKISPVQKFIGLIGNNGYVNILSLSNGTFVKNFKIEGTVVDFCWNFDESILFIINSSGMVHEFSFQDGGIISKWQDENGVGITKITIGGKNDKYLAIGSNNGIVNIYDRFKNDKPKVIENLTTTISSLCFNHDGQILCIASRAKKDALRLVHLPSGSVFSNWPTSATPLGKVTSVAFSKNSEMFVVGNEAGKARLFKLNDY